MLVTQQRVGGCLRLSLCGVGDGLSVDRVACPVGHVMGELYLPGYVQGQFWGQFWIVQSGMVLGGDLRWCTCMQPVYCSAVPVQRWQVLSCSCVIHVQ